MDLNALFDERHERAHKYLVMLGPTSLRKSLVAPERLIIIV